MSLKKSSKELVDDANGRVRTLSVEEALARHGAGDAVFVDLRDVRELEREGMIPGAFHAPRGMLEFWVDPDSPYHKDVFASGKEFIFYCQSGWRSALATDVVREMGLEPVSHIGDGFRGWKEHGAPVGEKPSRK
jgi:rhodanese-related sulfurtransferase